MSLDTIYEFIVEINGFPFFADEFEYSNVNDISMKHTTNGNSHLATSGMSFTATISLSGRYIKEKVNALTQDDDGVPNPLEIDVRELSNKSQEVMFEDALVSDVDSWVKNGTTQVKFDIMAQNVIMFEPNS